MDTSTPNLARPTTPDRARTREWSAAIPAAGLATGAVGIVIQAIAGADLPRPVPPGAVILTVAAILTWRVRHSWTSIGGSVVAALALLNVPEDARSAVLGGDQGIGIAIGAWMLLLGAATALAWGPLLFVRARGRRSDEDTPREAPDWRRRAQIAGLLVLAPVCAEYLAAYDESTGDVVYLVGGLLIFIPLYGAPALLIREVSRRANLGWTGIILMAAAFGLTQAGLVDQSLFSLNYRNIESWDESLRGTFVAALGLSAFNVLNFVGGHIIFSICAPIALVEAYRPSQAREPWIGVRGLIIVTVLYVAASMLILQEHLTTETSHASVGQIIGSAVVVSLLVLAAVILGRPRPNPSPAATADPDITPDPATNSAPALGVRPAPRVRTTFLLALPVALIYTMALPTWTGVGLAVSALVVGGVLVQRASRSAGWGIGHVVAVAAPFLLARAVLAFMYFPVIGEVSAAAKYGHNVVLLAAVLVISVSAGRAASTRHALPLP